MFFIFVAEKTEKRGVKTLEKKKSGNKTVQDVWFDEIISKLRVDELLIKHKLLDKERSKMYKAFIKNDYLKIAQLTQEQLHKDLTKYIIYSYLDEIIKRNAKPKEIAFDYSSKGVLVWAVLNDNDEKSEDALILSEAKINYDLADKFDYHISTTILEESDKISIPKQYKKLL